MIGYDRIVQPCITRVPAFLYEEDRYVSVVAINQKLSISNGCLACNNQA